MTTDRARETTNKLFSRKRTGSAKGKRLRATIKTQVRAVQQLKCIMLTMMTEISSMRLEQYPPNPKCSSRNRQLQSFPKYSERIQCPRQKVVESLPIPIEVRRLQVEGVL